MFLPQAKKYDYVKHENIKLSKILTIESREQLVKDYYNNPNNIVLKYLINKDNFIRSRVANILAYQEDPYHNKLGKFGFETFAGGKHLSSYPAPEFIGTSTQLCGIYPFLNAPMYAACGAYLGVAADSGQSFHFDPLSWFVDLDLLTAPTGLIIAEPGVGKTSLSRRMTEYVAQKEDTCVIFPADIKPDQVKYTKNVLEGQVVSLSPGEGHLNPLDTSMWSEIYELLLQQNDPKNNSTLKELETRIIKDRTRRLHALIKIVRDGERIKPEERTLLDTTLKSLDNYLTTQPLLGDIEEKLKHPTEEMFDAFKIYVPKSRKDYEEQRLTKYFEYSRDLQIAIHALGENGIWGDIFAKPTDINISTDTKGICIDVSKTSAADPQLKAAVMFLSWEYCLNTIDAHHLKSDYGFAKAKNFFIVLDELWQVISTPGMAEAVNALLRLIRTKGSSLLLITHSIADFDGDIKDRQSAAKIVTELCGSIIVGATTAKELDRLKLLKPLTEAEEETIKSFGGERIRTDRDYQRGRRQPPPSRGNFILKTGISDLTPGVLFNMRLTQTEIENEVHESNTMYKKAA